MYLKYEATDLYLFMLAATGPKYDLGTIFELTRKSPDFVELHIASQIKKEKKKYKTKKWKEM